MDPNTQRLLLGAAGAGGGGYWGLGFNDSGDSIGQGGSGGGELGNSLHVVSDNSGNLYVVNTLRKKINLMKISGDGQVLLHKQKGLGTVSGLAISPAHGLIFTAQQEQGGAPHFSTYSTADLSNVSCRKDDNYVLSRDKHNSLVFFPAGGHYYGFMSTGSASIYCGLLGADATAYSIRQLRWSSDTYNYQNPCTAFLSNATQIVSAIHNEGGSYKLFLVALPGGSVGWTRSIDYVTTEPSRSAMTVGPDDSVYVAVQMSGKIQVHKFNYSGNIVWSRRLDTPASGQYQVHNPYPVSMIVIGDRLIIGGHWSMNSIGMYECSFLLALDVSGNMLWCNEVQNSYSGVRSICKSGPDSFVIACARPGSASTAFSLFKLPADGSLAKDGVSSPISYYVRKDVTLATITPTINAVGIPLEAQASPYTTATHTEVAQSNWTTPSTLTPAT